MNNIIKTPIENEHGLELYSVMNFYKYDDIAFHTEPKTKHDEVLLFIQTLRGEPELEFPEYLDDCANGILEEIFTKGNCGWFYFILRNRFPEAKAVYLSQLIHVVTEIDGKYYDIRGQFVSEDGKLETEYVDVSFLENYSYNYSREARGPVL